MYGSVKDEILLQLSPLQKHIQRGVSESNKQLTNKKGYKYFSLRKEEKKKSIHVERSSSPELYIIMALTYFNKTQDKRQERDIKAISKKRKCNFNSRSMVTTYKPSNKTHSVCRRRPTKFVRPVKQRSLSTKNISLDPTLLD